MEPLGGSFTNIKLEDTTVVNTVDLTMDEEMDCETLMLEKHNKWLNGFQQTAKQLRNSQIIIEKQQTIDTQNVICLDSDTELEELFVDSYPITNTPLNCESGLETYDAEDADDVTKLSTRFLPGTLRTYQIKKDKETTTKTKTTERERRSQTPETDRPEERDLNLAYRRDSIHISSTPPQRNGNDEDEGTDVQDENNDDVEPFLPLTPKKSEKLIIVKEPKPVSLYPYPSISLNTDKVIFSQAFPRAQLQQYYSDSSEAKVSKSYL